MGRSVLSRNFCNFEIPVFKDIRHVGVGGKRYVRRERESGERGIEIKGGGQTESEQEE